MSVFALFGSNQNAASSEDAGLYPTEFHKLYHHLPEQLDDFCKKYSLITTVIIVVGSIFGFSYTFSFSLFNLINGAFWFSVSGALLKQVLFSGNIMQYASDVERSARRLIQFVLKSETQSKKGR